MKSKKLQIRLAIVIVLLITVAIVAFLALMANKTFTFVSDLLHDKSEITNHSFQKAWYGYLDEAHEHANMVAVSQDVINAVIDRNEYELTNALKAFGVGFDFATLCDSQGIVLARLNSSKNSESMSSQKVIATTLNTGNGIKSVEKNGTTDVASHASAAIKDENGNIIGAVEFGHDLSQQKYIDSIKEENNCEATFFIGGERLTTTLLDDDGNRAVGTKAKAEIVDAVINNGQTYNARLDLFGDKYEAYYSPFIVENQVIGMLFTGVHVDDILKQELEMTMLIIAVIVLLIVVICIVALLITWTVRKIYWYETILDAIPHPISVTDMDMRWTFINKPVEKIINKHRDDVLGEKCSNWGAGICNTDNCGINCLRNNKFRTTFEQMNIDFQVDVSYIHDSKGKSIGHIEVVQDISENVKVQKSQAGLIAKVGNNSQALSQGATEQASAIEQLASSIAEVAAQTKETSTMTNKTVELAKFSIVKAETGSEQMSKLTQSVREINEANRSIINVIKIIDDIAFQTNILALNAAIEAARAGQHGKGFAVVSEEVRNLAAKSADAAKNTANIIESSMEKAELGMLISEETSAALEEIVSGINESAALAEKIASLSSNQSAAIEQINLGIEQVAQVVQQNSATAVEMDELVSQFNLENSKNT